MLYSAKNNHIGTVLYLIHVKVVLFAIISAASYYQFLGSTPFNLHVVVTVSNSYRRKCGPTAYRIQQRTGAQGKYSMNTLSLLRLWEVRYLCQVFTRCTYSGEWGLVSRK